MSKGVGLGAVVEQMEARTPQPIAVIAEAKLFRDDNLTGIDLSSCLQ